MEKTRILMMSAMLAVASVNAQNSIPLPQITLAQFAVKAQSPSVQIVDARTPEEFAQNHLQGAVNINAAAGNYLKELDKLAKDKTVLVYSIANGRSVSLARELQQKGFKEVYVLPGGISNWIGSGYPIVNNNKKGVSINAQQFKSLSSASDLVLIDFGSKYCGACKKLVPVLDSLDQASNFKAKVIKIEAYDNVELLKQLKINQLPTLVLYRDGKEVWKKAGQSYTAEIRKVVGEQSLASSVERK